MSVSAWVRWGGLILLTLFITACAAWQSTYLKEATGSATQAEVAERLGPPQTSWNLMTGETLWTYQYGIPKASGWGGVTVVGPALTFGKGSPCTEYVLLFDRQQILRAWMRQDCRPDA